MIFEILQSARGVGPTCIGKDYNIKVLFLTIFIVQGLRVQRSIRNGVLERATVFCRLRRSEAVNRQADFRIFISGFELGYVVNSVQIDQN